MKDFDRKNAPNLVFQRMKPCVSGSAGNSESQSLKLSGPLRLCESDGRPLAWPTQ